jgi:hypothetical protein
MKHADIKAMMAEIAPVIREYTEAAVAPLRTEIAALEKRLADLPTPEKVDTAAICRLVEVEVVAPRVGELKASIPDVVAIVTAGIKEYDVEVARRLAELPPAPVDEDDLSAVKSDVELLRKAIADLPEPEAPPSVDEIKAIAAEEARAAVAAIPPADVPKTLTVDDFAPMIRAEVDRVAADVAKAIPETVEAAVKALPPVELKEIDDRVLTMMVVDAVSTEVQRALSVIPPTPAEKVDRDELAALVKSEAASILGTWDRPQDGKSVTLDDVRPIIEEGIAKVAAGIRVPKDGVNLAGAMIDRGGNLVLTLSDGTMKELGRVVGTDAAPVDMAAVERSIKSMFDAWPKPKDGRDGFALEHFDAEMKDGGRTLVLKFEDAERKAEYEFGIPVMLYRGVYREGQVYKQGDTATWGGSLWHCDTIETTDKPDSGSKAWTLCAKKGSTPMTPPAPVKLAEKVD